MNSHDSAENPLEREMESRAQEQAEKDDLRQRIDALAAQEKTQPGATPESRKELQGQRGPHDLGERRLERDAGRNAREQEDKEALRQRLDGLSAQEKAPPGAAPESHRPSGAHSDSHRLAGRRLEREMGPHGPEQADKEALRQRLDALPSQERDHLRQETKKPPVSEEGVALRYAGEKAKDYPELEPGEKITFCVDEKGQPIGTAEKHADGTIRIWTCINDGTGSLTRGGRQEYESGISPGSEVGLGHLHLRENKIVVEPYERAHAAGQNCGPEAPYGISLAPREINQFQKDGPETQIRDLARRARPGVRLEQTVCVETDESGRALRSVDYEVDAIDPEDKSQHVLYRHGLRITGAPGRERVELDQNESGEPGPRWGSDADMNKYLR